MSRHIIFSLNRCLKDLKYLEVLSKFKKELFLLDKLQLTLKSPKENILIGVFEDIKIKKGNVLISFQERYQINLLLNVNDNFYDIYW